MIWFCEPLFFFFLNSNYSATSTIAIVFFCFFSNRFVFFSLLNIYVSWYIYCYTDKTNFTIFSQLLMCANALKHCSYMALVSWATFFFSPQVLNSNYSAKWHCSYSSYIFFFPVIGLFVFFFPFKYLCKLLYILLYWYNKFHNIFTIIDVPISYKSK